MMWSMYQLWSFKGRDTKLERFLAKNQHIQRNLLNFANWCSGEVSKVAQSWTLKVNFLCQKSSESFWVFSLKNTNLGKSWGLLRAL